MRNFLDDLRFARRMFARRRRFAALLIATIAVGIAAATSIFSLVDVVIWKQLPYRDAERLYWIARTDTSWRASPVLARHWDNLSHTLADYRQWATLQRSFEATGAWFATNAALITDNGAEQIGTARATASLAPLLGVQAHLGRWFLPGEDERGGPRIAVLAFESWRIRYGGDSAVIGRRITLNGQLFAVVGVMPPRFQIAGDTGRIELWTPAGIAAGDWQRGNYNFRVYGRLRDHVSPKTAAREAERLLTNQSSERAAGVRLERLQEETTKSVRTPLVILLAAAGLLLVIACGNVASLLVGESASRETEIATRLSLGATRSRITRQLVTEHLLLAALGGVIGTALAAGAIRVLRSVAPSGIPRIETAHVDWRGLAFAMAVTVATALVFSLGPLTTLLRGGHDSLLRARSSRVTRQRGWIERGGVFVQCALVVVLLAGAVLLVRTHRELLAVDVGFRAQELLSVRLRFLPPVTRYRDAESRRALLNELAASVATLPGVERAAAAYAVPFQSVSSTEIHVAGSAAVAENDAVAGTYVIASAGLLETMGIALRAGRIFGEGENGPGNAIIVSETFARRHWPNATAVGQRILVDDVWRQVVGVVADVRHASVDEETRTTFYLPAAQTSDRLLDAIVLRTSGDPRDLAAAVRRIVSQRDPTLAITRADRLSDLVDATLVAERFRTMLVSVFAVTAVLLATIGVVGVATNAAVRRRRELAIRMAVGASPVRAMSLVMTSSMAVGATGALAGVMSARLVARALTSFVYGVSVADPATYLSVFVFVVAIACAASWLPTRRAVRLDLARTLSAD